MNKRIYVINGLIIVGIIYSMAIGPGGGPDGAIQSRMERIVVLADDSPICLDAPFEIANEPTAEGDMQWNRTYGGADSEQVSAVIQTADGGFALVGSTTSSGAGYQDFWLVKTDASGNMQWNRTYGGSGKDEAYAVIQTTDGGFILAGCTQSFVEDENDYSDAWLVKIDAQGEVEWNRTYGGAEEDYSRAIIQTADGGYALAGDTEYFYPIDSSDVWLVKIDTKGGIVWQQTYGGSDYEKASTVIEMADGGFALAGRTKSFGGGHFDAWLVKTDAQGEVEWQQTYGGPNYDCANAMIETADGGFALAGLTKSYTQSSADTDAWLVKTDAQGEVEWQQTYGGPDYDCVNAMIETADGEFTLAGFTYSYGAGRYDAWLVKTDAQGEVEWQQTYGGSEGDSASAVIETVDGGFVIGGTTFHIRTSGDDVWLMKIESADTTPPIVTMVSPNSGDIWRPRAPMPTPRNNIAAVVVDERIYVIGGYNGTHTLATVEEYDPVMDTWRSRAPMPTARGWLAAIVVEGKIYVLGGWDGTNYLPIVEEYDPTTDTWRPRVPMPTHRYGLAVVAVGGRIYAIGGQNEIGAGYLTTIEEYDPATDTWRPRADMATRRYGLAAAMVRGRIYALGGYNVIDGPLATVEEYNPILNTWRRVADMPTAQISLAAGTVGGRLYAIGGFETYPSPLEEYDPLTDTWERRTPLPTPRAGLAAAVVRGRLYAIGGYDGNRRLGTVEEYDPPFYDTDGDGFADDDELRYGRDPLVPEPATETDTDGDGLLDTEEVTKYGTNPWVPDTEADTDEDGLANVAEVDRYGTNPTVVDTDGDGLGDGVEVLTYKTNPLGMDSDGDGLADGAEVLTYETDPLVADTDGDTYSDGAEVAAGTDPQDPAEHPSTTTGTATDTATTDTPAAFIPGFTLVELVLALACLVVLTRRKTKQ